MLEKEFCHAHEGVVEVRRVEDVWGGEGRGGGKGVEAGENRMDGRKSRDSSSARKENGSDVNKKIDKTDDADIGQ